MASRKKLLTSVVALGTAAALVLGGTFAWQSINQTALNQSSDDVNPGGRLHDDFNGENKDVYVENFAEEPIFARIRLEEYLEVVVNNGGAAETVEMVIGTERAVDADGWVDRTGKIFDFTGRISEDGKTVSAGYDEELSGGGTPFYWWTWTMGSADSTDAYYMPTFNLNKDSLEADINGYYTQRGMITDKDLGNQYTEMKPYTAGTTEKGIEIFDADDNLVDEVMSDTKELSILQELAGEGYISINEDVTHTAAQIGDTKGLISMADWLALNGGTYSEETHGGYWVYDTDGWVYWSSPIQPHTTTGRLLDGIKRNHVMDDSWYYSINVVAQFVTADDIGQKGTTAEDGTTVGATGFYDTTKGTAPTDNAWMLLNYITGTDEALPPITDLPDKTLMLSVAGTDSIELNQNESAGLMNDSGGAPSQITLTADGEELNPGTDYTYSGGVLTLLTAESCEITVTYAGTQTGKIYANGYEPPASTAKTVPLTLMTADQIQAAINAGTMDDGLSAPTVSVSLGDRVSIKLSGVTNWLNGYSETNSAVKLFKINDQFYNLDTMNWERSTSATGGNTETYTIPNYGKLTLDYSDNATDPVLFEPQQTATIVVTVSDTEYTGTVTVTTLLPPTGGGLPSGGGQADAKTLTVKLNAGDYPTVLSVKDGDSVLLQNEDGSTMGDDALEEVQFQISSYTTTKGTDYTYEDGTLTLMGDKLQAGLCVALYFKDGSNKSPDAWLIYEDADQITLNKTVTIGTVAALNEPVSMFYDDGTTPVSGLNNGVMVFNADDKLTENNDYTFADGKLTIINSALKGKVLLARTNYTGLIYVEAD